MKNLPLELESLLPRINGIPENITRLRKLGELPFSEFHAGDPFALAQHHLRLALEGVFHVGAHILSRLPGGRAVEYGDIAERLGRLGVVDIAFAQEKLVPMAKMRNLLVHHYAKIDPRKVYFVITHYLGDIEAFLDYVKKLLEHPEKLGLTIE